MADSLVAWLDRRLYPKHAANWDDELLRATILRHLTRDMEILDVGAGAGRVTQMNFRGLVRRVVGVDPDPRVHANPFLDEAHQALADRLPFEDARFDLVFCDNVLEHLEHPGIVLKEIARVLKPGGIFLAKTPNRSHYMTAIARITPTSFHRFINRLRGRPEKDTFPTRYRMNSVRDVRYYASNAGLELDSIELIEGRPEYLRFNAITYLLGWLYERLVNSTAFLARFRIILLMEMRKPTHS